MLFLEQSSTSTLVVGPFVDETDGKTAETGLSIGQANVRVSKNAGAFAQKNSSTSCTHMENGYYSCPLNSTDTGTLGRLDVAVSMSGALPVWHSYMVLTSSAYNALMSTGLFNVNVTQISGDSTAADNLEAATDGTGYNIGNGSVVAASVTAAVSVTGDLSATMKTSVQTAATASLNAYDPPTRAELTSDVSSLATASALSTVSGKIDTVDTVVDAILVDTAEIGAAGAGLTALASAAALATVDGIVDDILVDTGTTIPAQISGLNDLSAADVNAEMDAALADIHLDHLLANTYDPASKPGASDALLNELVGNDGGVSQFTANALELAPSGTGASAASIVAAMFTVDTGETEADAVAGSVVYEIVQNAGGGGGLDAAGVRAALGMASPDMDTQLDAIKADTAATLTDTNELQGDWANGGRLDLILDARASQASVDTIDGNVDSILVDTDTTIPGLIGALNDLSAADVNAEVDSALADYDGPTNAEMVARTLAAADYATATNLATVDGVVDAIKVETAAILDDTGTAGVVVAAGSKTDYRLSSTGVNDILDAPISESDFSHTWSGATLRKIIAAQFAVIRNKWTATSSAKVLRNDADSAALGTRTLSDNGTTYTEGEMG